MRISIKASHNNTNHRFSLHSSTTYTQLCDILARTFHITPHFSLTYVDEDDDHIRVTNDTQLSELFRIATAHNLQPLRLFVRSPHDPIPPAPRPHQRLPRQTRPTRHPPLLESNPYSIAQRGVNRNGVHTAGAMHDDRLCGMRSAPNESRERYGMPPTSQPHINPFSRHDDPVHELHQQLSATHLHADTPAHTQTTCHTAPPESSSAQGARFPPGLFARLRAVKPETAAAFRALRDAWECANDKDAILQQARECVPILMTWGDLNLSFSNRQSLLPRCETLIEAINHVIRPVAGDVIADRGIQVVKAAVQDEAVVDTFLRILSTCSLDGHSGGGREHAWSDRGNVHMHVSCDRCGVCPITGSRFKALNHVNYDLCSQCHGNPHVNVGGYSFVQLKTRFEIHCNIGCDGCAQMPILGPRYKATDAPSYDLCGTCYRNPERRGEHGFVELRYEVSDMLRPLQSTRPGDVTPRFEVPVTPIVAYNEHAGFMTGMRFPVLVCDGCQEQLFMGRRYTATNYPNYDLCVACYNDSSVNMYGMKFIEINRPAAGILGSDNLNMVNVRFGASNARLYTD